MHITPETHIADIAAASPGTIRVFQRHAIDFCCGGKRPLSEVCSEQGLEYRDLVGELEAAGTSGSDDRDWTRAPLGDLIDHIVWHYHESLRSELPRLDGMARKVFEVHGRQHPELGNVLSHVRRLRTELEQHMVKEELALFPVIRKLAEGRRLEPLTSGAGLSTPIGMMEHEHEDTGRVLAELRQVTRGYEPPDDACNTYRGLFHGLAELERDLHTHIHVENNILFPRALEKRPATVQ